MNKILKTKFKNKKRTIGSWITIGNTAIGEIMANVGFDWLVIDMEHSTISIDICGELIRVIDLAGVSPLVRLSSNDPNQIKRVMDAGAHGIIVPMVNGKLDAEQAVNSVHYAPKGERGVGLGRAQGYGNKFEEYLKWQKNSPVVIVQIEHKDAIINLDEILNVTGVDGFIIGPYDLSCSLGVPGNFDDPRFITAMNEIEEKGLKLNKSIGLHIVEPDTDQIIQAINKGYNFIAYSVDFRLLDVGLRKGLFFMENCK